MKAIQGFVLIAIGVFACAPRARATAPFCAQPAAAERAPSSVAAPKKASRRATREVAATGVTVIQLDEGFPIDQLSPVEYDVKTLEEFQRTDPWQDPDPKLRDRLFKESGIRPYLDGWDHLQRDLLFLHAQEDGLDDLASRFPGVPKERLKTLIQLIEGEKGAAR